MGKTKSSDALLTVCIQDLREGARLVGKRLPGVAFQATDAELKSVLSKVAEDAEAHLESLEATGRAGGAPANLWMDGILDDAKRDTKSITPGPLLDIALIGAVRKALAASRVSYDTAIALARLLGERGIGKALRDARDADREADTALAAQLKRLTAPPTQ